MSEKWKPFIICQQTVGLGDNFRDQILERITKEKHPSLGRYSTALVSSQKRLHAAPPTGCVFCSQARLPMMGLKNQPDMQSHSRCLLQKWPNLLGFYHNLLLSSPFCPKTPLTFTAPPQTPAVSKSRFFVLLCRIPASSIIEPNGFASQHSLPMLSNGYKWPVGCLSLIDLAPCKSDGILWEGSGGRRKTD